MLATTICKSDRIYIQDKADNPKLGATTDDQAGFIQKDSYLQCCEYEQVNPSFWRVEMCTIRKAKISDLNAITEIYNEAIRTTTATFDTEPKTEDEQKVWFNSHGPRYPILVAESNGIIVGWASLSKWSDRCAYSGAAEVSLYVKGEFRGKGIGRKLMEAIISEGKRVDFHTVIGRIAEGNDVSIHLAESVSFLHIGIMREVGRKFGKLLDVYLMQKIYPPDETVTSGNTE